MANYYKFQKSVIATVVILYFVIGNFSWGVFRHEIYPIFSWELFSLVPNLEVDYGLQIISMNESSLEKPTYFQELPNDFKDAESIIAFFVIQDLGKAIDANDQEAIIDLRDQIETTFFSSKNNVEYAVVKRSYHPVDRWKTGKFEEEILMVTYVK
ncbi:MAG: hypothetical protein AAGD96_26025 [Chloroflexota bacterium]